MSIISYIFDEFDSLSDKIINENNLIDCKSVMHLQCVDLSSVNCDRYENFIDEKSTLGNVIINIENSAIKCVLENIILVLNEYSFMTTTRFAKEVSKSIANRLVKIIETTQGVLDLYAIPEVKRDVQAKRWCVSVYLKSLEKYYLLKLSVGYMGEDSVCEIYTFPQTTE